MGPLFIQVTATLFNQIFNLTYFPKAWKTAKVISIHKKGKPASETDSYRPIALLPCISKLYECLVKQKITGHCDDKRVLPPDQYGFIDLGRTEHPLVKVENHITTNINAGLPTIAVSLDVAKAFDTTWIEGLVFKMMTKYEFDEHLCRIVYHYLSERTFFVSVNGKASNTYGIAAGVPQGGVLSATLFIIYIADMCTPSQHAQPIHRLQYADDTLIYVSARDVKNANVRINEYIEQLQKYYEDWKIRLNPTKCEAIVFKGTNRMHSKAINQKVKNVIIKIGTDYIKPQKNLKYLGVIFEQKATHYAHVKETRAKAVRCVRSLTPILRKVRGLHPSVKMLCYKQLVRPIISYGFACWSNISSSQMEKVRVLERKCMRMCTNTRRDIGSYMHVKNDELYKRAATKRIDKFMADIALKFLESLSNWNSPVMIDELENDPDYLEDPNNVYKPPSMLLHLQRTGRLNAEDPLLFYHRRHRFNAGPSLVYNTAQ